MSANYIYEPYVHIQDSAITTWRIEHNFGRKVNIGLLDASNIQTYAKIFESSLDTTLVYFYERGLLASIAGTAVVS